MAKGLGAAISKRRTDEAINFATVTQTKS